LLREHVVVPVRRQIISIANLSTAGSLPGYIGERLISAVRKTIISAIHIAPRELVPGKRAARIHIYGTRTEIRRSSRSKTGRRKALARIHHSIAAETSHSHRVE